jgi:AraC-like DNA-binding protein
MNYSFPEAIQIDKKNLVFDKLAQPVLQGSRQTYLLTQGPGHILVQEWEVGQCQLRFISMASANKEVFSFRGETGGSMIILCLEGNLAIQDHLSGIRRLRKHHGLFLEQDHFQGFCTMNSGSETCRILLFSFKDNKREDNFLNNTNPVFGFSPILITQIDKLLFTSYVTLKPFHMELVESILTTVKTLIQFPGARIQMNEDETNLLNAFKEYLDTNIGKRISISSWSQNNGIAARRLSSGFKNQYGKTTRVYLREKKLERAKEAVCFSKKPLKQISKEAGYRSYSNFSSAFHLFFGQTPALMRKEK